MADVGGQVVQDRHPGRAISRLAATLEPICSMDAGRGTDPDQPGVENTARAKSAFSDRKP